jgi:TRAP-type C4-dicarboxylate transport system permease small subunit
VIALLQAVPETIAQALNLLIQVVVHAVSGSGRWLGYWLSHPIGLGQSVLIIVALWVLALAVAPSLAHRIQRREIER